MFYNSNNNGVSALVKESAMPLAKFFAIAGLAVILPFFHNQLITGPIINAIFFIAVIMLGARKAYFIALIPSVIALVVGLLPFVLFPIVPVIMLGNLLQIYVFDKFKKKFWTGMIFASLAKFALIFTTGSIIFNVILKKDLASAASIIISWPQLLTALAGGALAYFFLKLIKMI